MEDELKHYGVPGMKWGVRKDPSKAFAKASRKADKLREKAYVAQQKATKQRVKSLKRLGKRSLTSVGVELDNRAIRKHAKAEGRAYNTQKKSHKWEKQMSRSFANVKVSEISKEDLNAGREYVYMLLQD